MCKAGEDRWERTKPGDLVHMKRDARFLSSLVLCPRYDTCNTENINTFTAHECRDEVQAWFNERVGSNTIAKKD